MKVEKFLMQTNDAVTIQKDLSILAFSIWKVSHYFY